MGTGATILIVEDERVVAADLAAVLRQLGYNVCGMATSHEQALSMAASLRPDLALMDVKLRGAHDGISTAAALRERHGIPVVYLTAFADDATLERARATRPYGYLIKPFRDRELKIALEIAMHQHELESRLEAVLGNIEEAVALVSADGQIILTNANYHAFSLGTAELAGGTLTTGSVTGERSTDEFELSHPRRVVRRTIKPIRVGAGYGTLVVWRDLTAEVDLAAERQRVANTDPLTGLGNRRTADEALARAITHARDERRALCLAVFDVDHFKQVNDRHGHAAGDAVLQAVARTLDREARGSDTIVRWGGDEMLAILPGELDGALAFCERVRSAVAAADGLIEPITVSAGVVQVADGEAPSAAVARADAELYQAKRAGRNRVTAAGRNAERA